ncbi:putative 4-hydroxy-4-methyl-2-oxoglutarate aldolase [Vibrio kyushuensis]|uniref:putative 4-hydroxy-4-methyl-2-oxoglutarate aldolase n=1 Tax=Vibrio kyushuensis TaxID=2910249 RepID=UPI003D109305
MNDITPDICDQFEDKVTLIEQPLQNFGLKDAFYGQIETVRCYHDNSKVRDVLSTNGKGKVLVVDGSHSCKRALMGDQVAIMAIENDWEGVIIFGAVRDVAVLSQMELGIKAIGACPLKTEKRGAGQVSVPLSIQGQMILPSDYIYADWNGVLTSKEKLL